MSIPPVKTRVWAHNKMAGTIVSHDDPSNRLSTIAIVQKQIRNKNIISVGRLDFNSTGLLLLTNNGKLANKLMLPKTRIRRKYQVCISGNWHQSKRRWNAISKNVAIIDDFKPHIVHSKIRHKERIHPTKTKVFLEIVLAEGKNRELRRIFQFCGMFVESIHRTNYGPTSVRAIPLGHTIELKASMVNKLLSICDLSEVPKQPYQHLNLQSKSELP